MKNSTYRPEIDGLRALAVIPVLLFHAGLGPFTGGYVGVDIFFVISGFLITSIIYREISEKKFTYTNFYERRARRILPALYLVLFVSILPAWLLLIPSDFIDFSKNMIGAVGFSSNITLWLQQDYFAHDAELKPLLHTWSLAVEEQYYLFFPILLMSIYRYAKQYLIPILMLCFLMSLALAHWGAFKKPSATYYLLPTRAWELLIGSFVALILLRNIRTKTTLPWENKANMLSLTGFGLIMYSLLTFNEHTPFPSLWTLFPTIGTALIIVYAKPQTLIYSILSNQFFVGIGLISYSTYLWHQPIYAFIRQQTICEVTDTVMAIAFLLSIILAFLSWKYIEKPFRNKNSISTQQIWTFSLGGAFLFIIFSIMVIKSNGFESRFSLSQPLTEKTFNLPLRSNGWCFYSVDTNPALPIGENGFNCQLGNKKADPKILLLGDSYAGMYEPFWDTIATKLSLSINSVTTNWCHPSLTKSFWWRAPTPARKQCLLNRNFAEQSLHKYDAIIISGVWTTLEQKELMPEVYKLIQVAEDKNIKVIIMPQPPVFTRTSVMNSVYKGGKLLKLDKEPEQLAQEINHRFKQIAKHKKNVLFLTRELLFSFDGNEQTFVTRDNIPYSWDGGHISVYGSLQAAYNYLNKKNDIEKLKQLLRSD